MYDNGIGGYRVGYTAQGGARFEVTTSDFVTFSSPAGATALTPAAPDSSGDFPAGASGASSIGVTAAEYAVLAAGIVLAVSAAAALLGPRIATTLGRIVPA